MTQTDETNFSGDINAPIKYNLAEIISGMCEMRNIKNIEIERIPIEQSFISKLLNGKREIVKFNIKGPETVLSELKCLIQSMVKTHNK